MSKKTKRSAAKLENIRQAIESAINDSEGNVPDANCCLLYATFGLAFSSGMTRDQVLKWIQTSMESVAPDLEDLFRSGHFGQEQEM